MTARDPLTLLRKLTTPERIQEYLDALPFNHEKRGETSYSPLLVMKTKTAHCLEGALFAAAALKLQGQRPLLMNLQTAPGDDHHALALFKRDGLWGAISKTNHAVLRYRDPLYRTLRELALSYFHEYYLAANGRKTLRAYSRPLNLNRFGTAWMTSDTPLWDIAYTLAAMPHIPIAPKAALLKARPATAFERATTSPPEWNRSGKRR